MNKADGFFEEGHPFIGVGGPEYHWPSRNVDRGLILDPLINGDLGNEILEKVSNCMDEFGIASNRGVYPHIQRSKSGVAFHISTEGGWFYIDNGPFSLVSTHNLARMGQVIAFNTASDVLKGLGEIAEPPKIIPKGQGDYLGFRYFLPGGHEKFPINEVPNYFSDDTLSNLVSILDLQTFEPRFSENRQSVRIDTGNVNVRNGVAEGEGFSYDDIWKGTYIVARLMDSFENL